MTVKPSGATLIAAGIALLALASIACRPAGSNPESANPIVGTWVVKDAAAPFPYHLYVFNADGTLQQANPDAGDPRSSDSDGKGVWVADRGRVRGKWVEITADRTTHQYTGRVEITFDLKVSADTYLGSETVTAYGADGSVTLGPTQPSGITGARVTIR